MTGYYSPTSIAEALKLLHTDPGQGLLMGGGTDLLPDLRKGKKAPRFIVDLTRIPELQTIQVGEQWVEIGAAVTFGALKNHPNLQQRVPALAEAARSVGAEGIQNAATWVGNLVQAMPAADGAILALALEAQVQVVSLDETTWIDVENIFLAPGKSALDPSRQVVARLRFPLPAVPWGAAWQRVGRRTALTLPVINCAVKLELDGQRIQRAVIALGPVAPRPFRARQAEQHLAGQLPTLEVLQQAARLAQSASQPRDNVLRASRQYRLQLIPTLVYRALNRAIQQAQSPEREEQAQINPNPSLLPRR